MGEWRRGVAATMIVAVALIGLGACSSSDDHKVAVGESGPVTPAHNTARLRIVLDDGASPEITEGSPVGAVGGIRLVPVSDPIEMTVDLTTGATRGDSFGTTVLSTADGSMFVTRTPNSEGASWVRVPSESVDGFPFSGTPTDPVSLVRELRTAASSISDAGSGEVEGDATERFELSFADEPPGLVSELLGGESGNVTIDVDSGGRLRGISSEGIRIELWDFGVEADFSAPPPEEVVELGDEGADAILGFDADNLDAGEGGQPLWATIDEDGNSSYEPRTMPEDLANVVTGTWDSIAGTLRTGTNDAGERCGSFSFPDQGNDFPVWVTCAGDMSLVDVIDYAPPGPQGYLVAMTADDITGVTVTAPDGTALASTFYPEAHAFVIFGEALVPKAVVHLEHAAGGTDDCDVDVGDGAFWLTCIAGGVDSG